MNESFAEQVLTDARFWEQVATDSERTWLRTPDMESRVVGLVRSYGMEGRITVMASPVCPDGQVIVIDHHAVEAATRQSLARPITWPRW